MKASKTTKKGDKEDRMRTMQEELARRLPEITGVMKLDSGQYEDSLRIDPADAMQAVYGALGTGKGGEE